MLFQSEKLNNAIIEREKEDNYCKGSIYGNFRKVKDLIRSGNTGRVSSVTTLMKIALEMGIE